MDAGELAVDVGEPPSLPVGLVQADRLGLAEVAEGAGAVQLNGFLRGGEGLQKRKRRKNIANLKGFVVPFSFSL